MHQIFEDKLFQVTTVPTPTTFTITQSSNAGGTVSTGGSIAVKPYEKVGPSAQKLWLWLGYISMGWFCIWSCNINVKRVFKRKLFWYRWLWVQMLR